MQNHIRNTNLRFNLEKDLQRKAWEYLQSMNREEFKSYSHAISLALVDYFDRYYRIAEDPYLETREREEQFINQIVEGIQQNLKQSLPLFLSGLTIGMVQMESPKQTSLTTSNHSSSDAEDVDWDFLGSISGTL